MAAVRKGSSGTFQRVPSAGSGFINKPKGAPLRAIHPNSSPIYKTKSESALTAGLSNLSIKDGNIKNKLNRRNISGGSRGHGVVKNLKDAAHLLQTETVKSVVVVAGAGISTPSGIPDFRSPGTGLYDNLQQYNIPYPEAIFDIDYFHVNPRPFFTLAKELYPSGKYRPNYIHYFVRHLYDKGLLLRMYTQNIDGLERLAGLPADKLMEAHGTFATATCTVCKHKMEGEDIKEKIFADKLPRCPNKGCMGIIKPDIVFFGEDLPRKFYNFMKDMLQTDMVLVMGTSLEVQPFAGIIDTVRFNVPRVLFNREAVGPFKYQKRAQDIVAIGDLIENMVKFAEMIGWSEDMKTLITKQEGNFIVAAPVTKINNSPKEIAKQNKPNAYTKLMHREKATFSLYNEDSSSEETTETTESESDVSTSDSSEVETKRGEFSDKREKFVNNTKNGSNGKTIFRSSSAKIDSPNRKIHTQREILLDKNTGRIVKSENVLNNTVSKQRFENRSVTKRSNAKDAAKEKESIIVQEGMANVIEQNANDVPSIGEKEVETKSFTKKVEAKDTSQEKESITVQAGMKNVTELIANDMPSIVEKERILRKYGLSPHSFCGKNEPINELAGDNVTNLQKTVPFKSLKSIKSDGALVRGYFMDNIQTLIDLRSNDAVMNGNANELDECNCKNEEVPCNDQVIQPQLIHEEASLEKLKKDKQVWLEEDSSNEVLYMLDNMRNDKRVWHKDAPSTEDFHLMLDNVKIGQQDIDICSEKSSARNHWQDRHKTMLSDKTVQSFAKYANLATQRIIVEGHTGKQLRRKKLSGSRLPQHPVQLGTVNARPYGYAHKLVNNAKNDGLFQRTNIYTRPSSLQVNRDVTLMPGSADFPKITFRHRIHPALTYDAQLFGVAGAQDSSTNIDSSENDFR